MLKDAACTPTFFVGAGDRRSYSSDEYVSRASSSFASLNVTTRRWGLQGGPELLTGVLLLLLLRWCLCQTLVPPSLLNVLLVLCGFALLGF